jgi:hypothetical protein
VITLCTYRQSDRTSECRNTFFYPSSWDLAASLSLRSELQMIVESLLTKYFQASLLDSSLANHIPAALGLLTHTFRRSTPDLPPSNSATTRLHTDSTT